MWKGGEWGSVYNRERDNERDRGDREEGEERGAVFVTSYTLRGHMCIMSLHSFVAPTSA